MDIIVTLYTHLFLFNRNKYYKNNFKIMNLKREVGIDCCHKKQGNKVEIMHLLPLCNLSNG